jgi:hypothetical protein
VTVLSEAVRFGLPDHVEHLSKTQHHLQSVGRYKVIVISEHLGVRSDVADLYNVMDLFETSI